VCAVVLLSQSDQHRQPAALVCVSMIAYAVLSSGYWFPRVVMYAAVLWSGIVECYCRIKSFCHSIRNQTASGLHGQSAHSMTDPAAAASCPALLLKWLVPMIYHSCCRLMARRCLRELKEQVRRHLLATAKPAPGVYERTNCV
jgi:hypothetical protein